MAQPTDVLPLDQALAAFRATRSAYQSTSDQALSELLVSLAEEVVSLRRQLAVVRSQPAESQPDLAALQAQLAALQAAYESQQVELAQLRASATSSRVGTLRSEVVSPPREMRPMDYWEQHVPDYGDTTTESGLATYRARPRVRPEDVALTTEDYARLERRRPAQPLPQWVTTLVWIVALLLLEALI